MAQEPDDINLTNQELQVLSELDSRLFGFLKLNSPEQSKKKELVLKAVKYLECMLVQAQKEKEHRQHIEKREIVCSPKPSSSTDTDSYPNPENEEISIDPKTYCKLGHFHLLLENFSKGQYALDGLKS